MRKGMLVAMAAVCGAMSPVAALADAREDVISGVTRCAVLTDDRQWLDCYYGAAQPMRSQLGLAPAPQAQIKLLSAQPKATALPTTVSRAAVRSGPPPMPKTGAMYEVWGGSDLIKNTPVKSYEMTNNGFSITLPDGQVWTQTPDDAARKPARWNMPASAMRVTISQGAMRTFNLVMNDENVFHKVKRSK